MRLTLKTKWLTEAKFNLGDRKHSNHRKAGPFIKNQATREQRRNSKAIIKWEVSNGDID